jgi:hypothetical protein
VELIGRLDHDIGRAGDQVVGLEQPVNRGFRHEVALLVGEVHGQFPGAQLRLFQRQLDDLVVDISRDAVPHPARRRWPIFQRLRPAFKVAVIPAVECPAGDAELVQRALGRQVRLLDDPDDLELLGCGIPHSSSPPSAIMLFLSRPVFQRQIGHAFLQRTGFAAQVLHLAGGRGTGSVARQAALARFHELLRPGVVQALSDPFLAAQLGDAVFPAQAIQHDADLVLGREVATGLTPDVLHHLLCRGLGWRFCIGGSGLHLRSFVTTTKPRSSLNHNLKSVPWALTADNGQIDYGL